MAKGKIEAAFPLTPLQEGMLYHALKEPGSGFYHGQVSFRLESAVRPELLRRAFQRAADRHESLRTFFVWRERDRPIQVVRGQVEIPWTDLDWPDKTNEEVEESWDRLLAEDAAHPFELSVAPLTRVTLVRCGVDAYRVLWSVHHGVSDGWSGSLIVREVLEDYQALAAGLDPPDRPPPPSYARFVGWLESADLNQEERYWRDELGSLEAPTPLPFSTGQATRRAGRTRKLALPDEVYARLKQRAAAMRVTPATVVAGAWGLLLARYAGAEQVVFGSTVSERPAAISGVDSATGLFLNTVPVRAQVDSGMAPAAFLQRLQAAMSAGRAHGVAGLSRIARWSGLAPGDPLFRTVVVFESFPAEVDLNVDATSDGGLDLSHLSIDGPSDLPLGLVAVPGNGLRLELKHDPGLYDTRAADRLLLQFRHILDGLIRPETRAIGTIDCLPAEHDRIVKSWSRGPDLSGTPVDVVELFERAVDRDPTRIALSAQGHDLSYQDLDQATTALAHELRQRGLGPDHLVAVPASRSAETVIAFLSVLKAGAAYAPLDPDLPPVRRDKLLESFDLVLRTDPGVWRHLDTPVVDVARPQGPPLDRLLPTAGPDAPAYVIFTSGSTGAPKGVVVTRSNLAHSNYARFDAYPSNPDAFLLLSPLWVDSSVAGLYWTLTSGGTLTIPRPRAEQDPRGLWKLIRDAGVTHTLMVPSLYGAVLDEIGEEDAAELSTVIMAGESTPGDLVPRHVASIPEADLVNEYGPSEATVWATVDDLTRDPGGPVTIGRPVPSYQVHVLDEAQRPTGIGIEGEIVIGGPGIARGYLGARELTAERFLPDPSGDEGRVYHTGDRGRWLDDGRIQFLGRADQQLKIRGFRVELEEIEASIRAHPKVEDVALDAGTGDPGSTPLLTAYLVSQDRDLQGPDIESWLADRLPRYMLPERYVSVSALPTTPAGKLDRRALSELDGSELSAPRRPSQPPRNAEESALAEIWREVLGLDQVGIQDDFFDLGGDSLSSIRLLSQASRAGFEIDPETFFRSPTIAAMAEGKAKELAPSWTEPVGTTPLTPVQRWFFHTVKDDRAHWNQDHVLVFEPGVLPTADVTRVMTTLVRHHDALRTRFVFDNHDEPLHQEIVGTSHAWIRIVTASSSQESDLRETLERALVEAHGSMDLRRPELFRTVVVDYEGHVRLLALISHHLIVDAVSWGVLIEDLASLVDDTSSDPDGSLPPKTKPWTAWARDLARRAEEVDGPSLVHATDPGPPRPSPCALRGMGVGRVGDAVRHTVRFEKEDLAALDGARARLGASMEELLLAGFLEAWHDWCGAKTLLMDLEGHGRGRDGRLTEVHRTVGWFTTVTPFRGRLGVSSRDTLRAVQRAVPRARESGLDQSLVRYLSQDPVMRAEMDRRLATDVVFNYLGTAASFPTHLPFSVQPGMTDFARSPRAQRGYALEVNALVLGGGLDVVIEGGPGSEEELVRLGHALRESLLGLSMVDPVPFDLDGFGDGDYETLSRLLGRLALQS